MLEPQLPQPATQVSKAPNATSVRLLDTQARGHIGRRVLHQKPNGELTQDAVWQWSTAPDRYLDTALRLEVESSPDVSLVDTGRAPALAGTLLVWDLLGNTAFISRGDVQRVQPSLRGRLDSSELWSLRSQGPTVWSIHKWCEPVSQSQRSYLTTWLPQQGAFYAAWRLRVSRS